MNGRKNKLVNDQRGAVMFIGLFMALSLIGSLWFILGIGDAVVFHDRGQELADAASYSAATINARGMNLIAAINIIMLMLVTIYIFAQLIADVLFGIATALAASIIMSESAPPVFEASDTVREFAEGYQEAITPWLEGFAVAGAAVAMGVPWMGTVAALDVGTNYNTNGQGFTSLAFGGSNIPGFALTGGFSFGNSGGAGTFASSTNAGVQGLANDTSNFANLRGADTTLGLPVAFEPMQNLCARSVKDVLEFFKGFMQSIPVIGWVLSIPFVSSVVDGAISAIGLASMYGHCSGGIWDQNGPKKMTSENGGPGQQVWGLALGGNLTDTSDGKVMMAEGPKLGLGGGNQSANGTYTAQAEFFYDCEDNWKDDSCNGSYIGFSNIMLQHAVYSIAWKARVRRMDDPLQSGISLLGERFTNALSSNSFENFFLNVPGVRRLTSALTGLVQRIPGLSGNRGQRYTDTAIGRAFNIGAGALNNLITKPGAAPGLYH